MSSEPTIARPDSTPADAVDPREWTRAWLDAWNRQDLEAVLARLHQDVSFLDPGMLGDWMYGRDQVRNFVEMFFHIYPDATMERSDWPVYSGVENAGLAIPWRIYGTFSGDMRRGSRPAGQMALAPTGKRIDVEGVDVYVFKEGLVHKWSRVANGVEIMAQMHRVNLRRVGPPLMVVQHALASLLRRTRTN